MKDPKKPPDFTIDDELVQRMVAMDESVSAGDSGTTGTSATAKRDGAGKAFDADTDLEYDRPSADPESEELSDCLQLIDRVRRHSPDCMADLMHDDDVGSMWLDGGDEAPAQIGRFQIRRKLGQGGFGLVFLAFDPELQRDVALKVPRVEALITEETRARFLREGKAAASLSHRNIATVHEAGQIGPICFIVSAYCRGGSLAELIGNASTGNRFDLSPACVAPLMLALARAVEHAHCRGFLHRDLKPSNILFDVDADDSQERNAAAGSNSTAELERERSSRLRLADLPAAARIVDFGLAKSLHSDDQQTRSGVMVGTPSYMSPEQAAGDRARIGTTTDVYSLGAIMYELLTGIPPFKRATDLETVIAVKQDAPLTPRHVNPQCPKDLEAICLKCLEKDPARRYATAKLLASDLQRFIHGEPIIARRSSPPDRVWRWCRRYPLAAVFTALLVVLAIVGPLVAVNQARLYRAAKRAREDVRRTLYTSDMNLALRDWDEANLERCGELLQRHLPQPGRPDYRRFEWYYLRRLWQESQRTPVLLRDINLERMALSPDETTLAVGRYDGMISLWEMESRRKLREWKAHAYRTFALSFSADGKVLASANIDQTVCMWDVASGRRLAELDGMRTVAVSPVDATLAYSAGEGSIAILDPGQSQPRLIRNAHEIALSQVIFSPDGQTLASIGMDGRIRQWDVSTGNPRADLDGDSVWCIAWSPDGRYLALGDGSGTIKIWDASTGSELRVLTGHRATVASLAFTPDSTKLVSASLDNTVRRWNVESGAELDVLRGHRAEVVSVTLADEGKCVLSASLDGDVRIWDVPSDTTHDVLSHPAEVLEVSFAPDGQILATSCTDGKIRLWKTETGESVGEIEAHAGGASYIKFFHLERRLALVSTGEDSVMRVWDVDTREAIRSYDCRAGYEIPLPVDVAPDDTLLAFADADFTVQLFSLRSDSRLGHLDVGKASHVAFSPDGRRLAVATGIEISLWDVASARELGQVIGDSRNVRRVVFSPDGQTLASANYDRTVKLWDVTSLARGEPESQPPRQVLKGHGGIVDALGYSPDGTTLASGSADRIVRLWDTATGQQRAAFPGHTGGIESLVFAPDNQTLASASHDRTVRLWRAPRTP